MRLTAVTCVKNEGPYLLEWIAYHRLRGVTDFLFYSNDCDDGTDDLLTALAAHEALPGIGGRVHHLPNPAERRNFQMEALRDARRHAVVREADWLWIADVDEFADVFCGDGSFGALIAACPDAQAISLHFQFMANGGQRAFVDAPVIGQFDRSHNPDIWCDQTAIEVKTLVHRDVPLRYLGAHRPFLRKGAAIRWVDGSGRPVPEAFAEGRIQRRLRKFPARGARQLASLNHYALRSLEGYLIKRARGDVNREGRIFDLTYWQERNDSAVTDRRIQRHLPALEDALRRLCAVPEIAALHAACVAAHHAKARVLMADPEGAALARDLMALPDLPPQEMALIARLDGPA